MLEMLLAMLNEQGLEISSPWAADDEAYIVDALWPRIHRACLEKERWAGCTEVIDEGVGSGPTLLEGLRETGQFVHHYTIHCAT